MEKYRPAADRDAARDAAITGVIRMRFVRLWLAVAMMLPGLEANAAPTSSAASAGMSFDQFLTHQTSRILAADADGDGKISRAELAAIAKDGRDPARLFDRMDANQDGMLDTGEIQAALTKQFQRLDRNGDGQITPEERMARREKAQAMKASDAAPR